MVKKKATEITIDEGVVYLETMVQKDRKHRFSSP